MSLENTEQSEDLSPDGIQGQLLRESLTKQYGQVWTKDELLAEFDVIGFGGGVVVVTRKLDGARGSLDFTHLPRFYYNFKKA